MDLIAGTLVKGTLELGKNDVPALVENELGRKKFTGYVCVTIKETGFEEGIVFLDLGKIVGCCYEYLNHNRVFYGREAFQRFANATAAKNGVVDVFELTSEELHSVIAMNAKLLYSPPPNSLSKPSSFSLLFEQQLGSTGSEDFFEKFKLKGHKL